MKTILIILWLAVTPYAYEKVEIIADYQPHDWDCTQVLAHVARLNAKENTYIYDNKVVMAYQCGEMVAQKNS